MQNAPSKENQQNGRAVKAQNHTENEQVYDSKKGIEAGVGQEVFDAMMVPYSLQYVARHFGIKKGDRQAHEFDQKIRNQ